MADPISDLLGSIFGGGSSSAAPAPSSQPAAFTPSFAQRLNAMGQAFQGHNPGNLDQDAETKNATYRALIGKGLDPDTAKLATMNPAVLGAILPTMFGAKQAPQIVEFDGPYGQKIKRYWDTKTNRFADASALFGDGAAPSVAPPQPGAAPAVAPVSPPQVAQPPASQPLGMTSGAPPAPSPDAPDAPSLPAFASASPWAPKPQAAQQAAAPVAQQQPQQQAPALGVMPKDYVVGSAVPKPPDGYIHRMAPDGSGYLWNRNGQPVFESKAEADARAKGTEKRALEAVDQQQQVSGVKDIVASARKMAEMPGFGSALALGRTSLNLGIPTPWGTVGGDIMEPGKQIARMASPDNPAWGVHDDIGAVQQRLNLLVARPMMKGQGQVSDSERKMVSDAIGGLSKASSAADFQFRLNSVEQMIEAMNTGQKGSVVTAYAKTARPTAAEVSGSVYDDPTYGMKFRPGVVAGLAQKYNVREPDMQSYLNKLIMAGR